MANGVSIRPSEFVEGGAVPVDRNLTWKECRFALFDYTRKTGEKVASTIAARINYVDDDGAEFIQHYSAGDPERFQPSQDGKKLVPVGNAQALSKSSNFYILMNALINAGFPENKLDEDISTLDGMQTYNIGMPEPKRSGLTSSEPRADGRERVISVPSQILKLPWEKKATGKTVTKTTTKTVTATRETEGEGSEVEGKALNLVKTALAKADKVTRQELAAAIFKNLSKDPDKDAVARLVFKPEFQAMLLANGYTIEGEDISKAE